MTTLFRKKVVALAMKILQISIFTTKNAKFIDFKLKSWYILNVFVKIH